MILKVLKLVALLAGSCAVAWFAVIGYWRGTDYVPNVADVVGWLGVLPLGMTAAVYLFGPAVRLVRRVFEKKDESTVPESSQADVTGKRRRLVLLGSALSLPVGQLPQEVAEALLAGKRPDLDPDLRNDEGIPVFAARVEAADDAGITSEEARARLLARNVLTELLTTMSADDEAASSSAAASTKVIAMLSEAWSEAGLNEMRAELTQAMADVDWPPGKSASAALGIDLQVAHNTADVLRLLTRLVQVDVGAEAKPPVAEERFVILACESRISSRFARRWAQAGELLSANHQNGRILGEGACALMVTVRDDSLPRAPGEIVTSPIALVERGQQKPKGDPDAVAKLLSQVLEASSTSADTVGSSVCDADHRPCQLVEHAVAAQVTFPHLETEDACVNVGVGCGDIGVVAPLAAVAIGMSLATDKQAPSVVLSVSDPQARGALVISPPYVEKA